MIKHNDELSALIHACGPRIKDETIGLEDLEKRFEAVEDLRRDLEGRRQSCFWHLLCSMVGTEFACFTPWLRDPVKKRPDM